jgi:hypothetical protein
VTVDNGIFAGLTEDQQQRLEQALVLMLAEYARVQRCRSLDSQLQQPGLPLPQTNPAVVPPLRWLPAALRWLQTSPLAVATNLFGEADQQGMATALAKPGLWPIAIGRRSTSRAIVPQVSPETTGPKTIAGQYPTQLHGQPASRTLPATTSAEQGVEITVAMSGAVAVAPREPNSPDLAAQLGINTVTPDCSPSSTPLTGTNHYQLDSPSALDVKVTQINYVDPPLVTVLRGLDWVLYVLETWLRMAWAWLRSLW